MVATKMEMVITNFLEVRKRKPNKSYSKRKTQDQNLHKQRMGKEIYQYIRRSSNQRQLKTLTNLHRKKNQKSSRSLKAIHSYKKVSTLKREVPCTLDRRLENFLSRKLRLPPIEISLLKRYLREILSANQLLVRKSILLLANSHLSLESNLKQIRRARSKLLRSQSLHS